MGCAYAWHGQEWTPGVGRALSRRALLGFRACGWPLEQPRPVFMAREGGYVLGIPMSFSSRKHSCPLSCLQAPPRSRLGVEGIC